MSEGFTGGCLCGAVRFSSRAAPMMAGHCHCVDCRRSSGTGHCTHAAVPEPAFELSGKASAYDRPADSGNVVTRVFCGTCGSPLFSRNAAMPGLVFVRASSLDDPDVVVPSMIVYASRAPAWDRMDPDLPSFERMPPAPPGAPPGP